MKRRILSLIVMIVMFLPVAGSIGGTFIVTNTNDSGAGSLREAILNANAGAGQDTIVFQIPIGDAGYDAGSGTWSIEPATPFAVIVRDGIVIDGSTQKAFIGGDPNPAGPEIVVSGAGSGIIDGLAFQGNDATLNHITIAGFETQIRITGINNTIMGCYVGTDPTGTGGVGGSFTGVSFSYQASNNFIGGWTEDDRNVISGNDSQGLFFDRQSSYNTIINNYIGTDRTGTISVENGRGVYIKDGSHHNTLSGNVISGNSSYGVIIDGVDTDHNSVTDNHIGVDVTGDAALGNDLPGVFITEGAKHNTIGGTESGDGNIISDNYHGVVIRGTESIENIVAGNIVGLNSTGSEAMGNEQNGVYLYHGSRNNQIGPLNVISGNYEYGVSVGVDTPAFNTVVGNFIGTNLDGSTAIGNMIGGIFLSNGAEGNVIGGTSPGDGNLISGNIGPGVVLSGSTMPVDGTQILGNLIGTDAAGLAPIPNTTDGIRFFTDVINTVIGGEDAGARNVVSGNDGRGIYLFGTNITNNTISGNVIGLDVNAEHPIPNQESGIHIVDGPQGNVIGPGNIVAFNALDGISMQGSDCFGNTVTANSIYSNVGDEGIRLISGANAGIASPVITGLGSVTGTAPPNARVEIFSGPDDEGKDYQGFVDADGTGNFNFPGSPAGPFITATATDAAGNTSQFSEPTHVGPFVVTTTEELVEGSLHRAIEGANAAVGPDTIVFNIPVTDANYDAGSGVWTIQPAMRFSSLEDAGTVINGFSQADFHGADANPFGPEIEIDGSSLTTNHSCFTIYGDGITISGLTVNHFDSRAIYMQNVEHVNISGCYIGTDPTGTTAEANGWGIVTNTCSHVTIGPANGHASIISGNENVGIALDDTSMHNLVTGSIIGLDRTMTQPLGNGNYGALRLFDRADSNEVVDNYIGGSATGIYIYESSGNMIAGNYVGTDDAWSEGIGNTNSGIHVTADADSANGNVFAQNTVGYNGNYGIRVSGTYCQRNTITENRISKNAWAGIEVGDGANVGGTDPVIALATETVVNGTAGANDRVEVFADDADQGEVYLGFTDADGTGAWSYNLATPSPLPNITATATDAAGNTSNFSDEYVMTDVAEEDSRLPEAFALHQNYPNPFNPETTIAFDVKEKSRVILHVYDLLGRLVATLVDEDLEAGSHRVVFDASDLPSGIFIYEIQMGDPSSDAGRGFSDVRKMLLLE